MALIRRRTRFRTTAPPTELPTVIRNGENGFVFTAGDDVELSGYLDALTSDTDLRTGMSECSLQLIRSWDFTRGVRGVKEMLRWVTTR